MVWFWTVGWEKYLIFYRNSHSPEIQANQVKIAQKWVWLSPEIYTMDLTISFALQWGTLTN